MNTNDLNTALYEKMAAEQDKYRDWLKSQPPEEILHHTYEYTVREDIVMAMEDLELTDAQAQALLDSPTPLADVYRHFENRDICPNCGGRNGVLFAAPSSVFSFAHILVFLKCWKDNMGRKQIAAKELRIDENL